MIFRKDFISLDTVTICNNIHFFERYLSIKHVYYIRHGCLFTKMSHKIHFTIHLHVITNTNQYVD